MGLYDRDEALGANPSKGYEEFDGGIRHSQVLNEGYQKDNAGLIRDEIRRREKRRKASGTSATDVRNWASDTGALIKQVNGGFEHQSDEQGRLLYKPSRSDIFQNPDGKFVRTYRDRYGVEREDSADRDVEWKIGDNGKLIKDNKYNAPEEMDADEAYRSGNDDMRKLGREALYRRAISDAKKKYDDLGYELKNPELQKSKLSKKDFDIFAEDPDSLLDEDRSRYDATVSILEKEKQRYEAEGLKRRLESMTPEQWEQYSQDEEDKRFRGLSQEEFNREMKSRGDSLNARKLALQEAHSAKSAEFQKRIKELEADDEEFRENAKLGLYAEEIDFYHEAKAIREREKVRLQQEIDKWNAQSSEEKKAFERDSTRFNGFQSARNATNQQLERQRVDRGISDLDNRQEEMGIDEESLPEGSAAFAQARDALRSGDNESYNQALQSIAKAETDQSEKWTNYRDELESVYTILEDYYTPEALAQVGGMDYSTVKSTFQTLVNFGTLKSAGKTKSEGGVYEKDALTRIKAMFPGEISDDEVQKLAYKAIRANKWEGSSETARVLDSGEVVINPSAVWQKDAQEIDIGGLNASRYAKYKARQVAENIRKATLDMKIVDMGNYSRPFNNFVKENDYDLSSDEGKMEALTEFSKQQPGFFTKIWREYSNALVSGATSASTAIVGGAGFVTGFVTRNENLMSASADLMEAGASGARDLAGVTAMEGGDAEGLFYGTVAAAPSLAPVGIASTLGRALGALAKGLSTNAIKGGGKAAIRKFVAQNAPKAGIYAGGGLQSYGGMLSDTYLELKEKHGEADAKRMLNSGEGQWEAVVGGLATMATMKLFPEGKEAVFRGKDLSSSSLRSLARDAGGAKAALSALKNSPEMRKDIAVFLKETIGKGIKDEALQEASDQLIQGLAANYDSQEKTLGEIITESLEAGVIGGILGGAVTGGASAFGKGQDFDTRIANIRSQTFNEIGQTSAEDKAANINAALSSEGVEITPDSIKEIESLTGEYGLGMRHNQLAVRITEQEQKLAQARESGDYSASRKIEEEISDLTSQHKQLAQEDLAQGARAWNDIKTQRENANEAFKTAQEAQQEAVESNDQAAEQSASEALQEAQAQLQQADIASAIVKIAGGQNAEALTKAEVNALGVVREDGQLRLMTNEELEEAGLPASSIDIVGDALVITDDALASVEFLSPAAREYVTLDETQQRQVAARMAEEAAQAAEAEQALDKQPTTDEQEAPEADGEGQPLAQDEQQAAQPQTWTGSTEGGTQLSVEATSQEEAKKLLAIEADKTNEFLDSDSVQQASESGGVGLEQQQDSGAGINETSAPDSTIDQPTPPTVTNPNHRKHIGQHIQQSTNEQAKPVLSKLTPIVERVAPHFKNVTYTELPAETSGFAYDGNQLLVDLDKVIDNYGAGTDEEVTQFLRAAVVEEVIHKASTDTYQRPEAEETWSQIPDDIKQHVTETYYAAQVQATGQAPEMDSYTGFHEFVRMVIQSDEKVLGFISELPSQNAKLSERIAQIFKTILDVLSGVEENIPEVKIATARVREQMKAMGVMDADGNLTLYETPRNTASGEAFNQSNNQQIPQTDTGEVPTGDPGQADQGSGELPTGADGQPQGLKNTGEIAELVDDRVKGRKSEKIRPSDLFEPAKIADDPLIAYIRDSIGGLESKTRQKKRLGNNKNNAEFDGSSALTPATNKEIYSGNVRADEAANMLYQAGLINENSEDAMWEAIASAQNSIVSNNKAGIQQAKGEAAKANLRIDFEKRAFKKTKNAIEKDPSELLAGDKLTIKGTEFSVENVVTDEDGRAIEVVLDGGEKFGKQTLNADERIYVDSYTERQESGFLGGEESSAEQTTPRLGQGENQGDLLDSTGTDPGLSLQQETYTEPEAEEDTRTQDEIDADAGQSTMFGEQNLENPTSDSGITRSEATPPPADNPAAPEPLSAGEQALRDAFGSFDENLLGSSERVTSEDDSQKYNKPLPPAAMPNFIQAAQMLVSEGKTKPADIAAMIDKVTNKKARPYINAVYRMMQAVDTSLQSEVEWNNVYDAIDNPPEVGIKTQAVQGIVNQVNQNLQDNNPIDKKALKDQFDPDNTLSKKEHDEVIETAVTDFVHKQMETSDELLGQAYDKLVEVLGNQPALTAKTSQSKINQAYSTPAPLALTASRIANIADGNVILEPTAGHGMLLGETTSQQTVYYNEIDPARVARTQENIAKAENWNVSSEDATQLTIPEQADRIIANPPFGTLMQEDGSNAIFKTAAGETTQIDHAIVLQSLENMTDDGRAVFIIGGAAKTAQSEDARKAHYQSGARGRFFNHLYDNYGVVDHFTVNGDLYKKQGAGWDVDIIVIQGKNASIGAKPYQKAPRMLSSWNEVQNTILLSDDERVANITRTQEEIDAAINAGLDKITGEGRQTSQAQEGRATISDVARGGVIRYGATDGSGDAVRDGDESGSDGRVGNELSENVSNQSDTGRDDRLEGVEESRRESTDNDAGRSLSDGSTDEVNTPQPWDDLVGEKVGKHHRKYKSAAGGFDLDTLVPVNQARALAKSLHEARERNGNLQEFVRGKLGYSQEDDIQKYFAGEQFDAISLAINNIEDGTSLIIGDQTGIGKGRTAAGLIRYAINNGMTPVFVTKNPTLQEQLMEADLADIGSSDYVQPALLHVNLKDHPHSRKRGLNHGINYFGEVSKQGKLLNGANAVFVTYSQIQADVDRKTTDLKRRTQIKSTTTEMPAGFRVNALKNIKGKKLYILDEAHLAASGSSDIAHLFNHSLLNQEGASVVYLSATAVKRPDNTGLYFKTTLKEIFADAGQLNRVATGGGVGAMQFISQMLTEDGQIIRRERSYEGVEFDEKVVDLGGRDRKMSDDLTGSLENVVVMSNQLKETAEGIKEILSQVTKEVKDYSPGGVEVKQTNLTTSNFGSKIHEIVNQFLLSMKAKSVIDVAIEKITATEKSPKEKVVIAVQNTMESIIDSLEEQNLPLNFNGLTELYLRKMSEITLGKDKNKNPIRVNPYSEPNPKYQGLSDAELRKKLTYTESGVAAKGEGIVQQIEVKIDPPVLQEIIRRSLRPMYDQVKAQMDKVDLSEFPLSPIDYIREAVEAADIKTGEITGRTKGLRGDGTTYNRTSKERGKPADKRTIEAFNNSDLDLLIINESGSTGISLHASEKFDDTSRRHMIIAQPHLDINKYMQTLGRIHRSGQLKDVLPRFTQLRTTLPAEKRISAILAKKMASLNANTTSNSDSEVSETNQDIDIYNFIGDEAVMQVLKGSPDMVRMLENIGANKKVREAINAGSTQEIDGGEPGWFARSVVGYLAVSTVEAQEIFWESLESIYKAHVDYLKQIGEYTLEAEVVPETKTLLKQVYQKGSNKGSVFTSDNFLEVLELEADKKPETGDQMEANIKVEDKSEQLKTYIENADRLIEANIKHSAEKQLLWNDEKELEARTNLKNTRAKIADGYQALGKIGTIKRLDGSTGYGYVKSIKVNKDKFLTPSDVVATIVVNDTRREIKVPMSQFSKAFQADLVSGKQEWDDTLSDRKIQFMLTGNVVAAMSQLEGNIKPVSFRDEQGRERIGISVNKNAAKAFFEQQNNIEVKNETELLTALDKGNKVKDQGHDLLINKVANGDIVLSVPASQAAGGQFWRNPMLNRLIKNQTFEQKGNRMKAVIPEQNVQQVLSFFKSRFNSKWETPKDKSEGGIDLDSMGLFAGRRVDSLSELEKMRRIEMGLPETTSEREQQAQQARDEGKPIPFGNPNKALSGFEQSNVVQQAAQDERDKYGSNYSDKEIARQAIELLKTDARSVRDRLLNLAVTKTGQKVTEEDGLSPVDMVAAKHLVVHLQKKAIKTGDKDAEREAKIIARAYDIAGSVASAAMRGRKDEWMTRADRHRSMLTGLILGSDERAVSKWEKSKEAKAFNKKISNLEKALRRAESETAKSNLRKRMQDVRMQRLEAEIAVSDGYRKNVDKALSDMGITMEDIFEEKVSLKLKLQKHEQIVKNSLNDQNKLILNELEKQTPVSQIKEMFKLSDNQLDKAIQKIASRFEEELDNYGDAALDLDKIDVDNFLAASQKVAENRYLPPEIRERNKKILAMKMMESLGIPTSLKQAAQIEKIAKEKDKQRKQRKRSPKKVVATKTQLDKWAKDFEAFKNDDSFTLDNFIRQQVRLDAIKDPKKAEPTQQQLKQWEKAFEEFKSKPLTLDNYIRQQMILEGFSRPGKGEASPEQLKQWTEAFEAFKNDDSFTTKSYNELQLKMDEAFEGGSFDIKNPAHVQKLHELLEIQKKSRWVDYVKELFMNNILSAPSTFVTNLTGMAYATYRTRVATRLEMLSNIKGFNEDAPTTAELKYMYGKTRAERKANYRARLKESLDLAIQAWSNEQTPFYSHFLDAPLDSMQDPYHSGNDRYRHHLPGKFGRVMRAPTRGLLFADTLFKTNTTRILVGGMAYRLAKKEGLKEGTKEFEDFIASERATKNSLSWQMAAEKAGKWTFTLPLRELHRGGSHIEGAAKALSKAVNSGREDNISQTFELLGSMAVPFISTPIRLFMAGAEIGIPGLFNWLSLINNKGVKANDPDTGKETEEELLTSSRGAKAQTIAVNNVIAGTWAAMIWNAVRAGDDDDEPWVFEISGGTDWRETGKYKHSKRKGQLKPYSIRIGNIEFEYRYLDPFATALAQHVDTITTIKKMKSGKEQDGLMTDLLQSQWRLFSEKSFMQGIENLTKLASDITTTKNPGVAARNYITRSVSSIIMPNIVRKTVNYFEPMREIDKDNTFDAKSIVYQLVPQSAFAPEAKRDLYGNKIYRGGDVSNDTTAMKVGNFLSQNLLPGKPKIVEQGELADEFVRRANIQLAGEIENENGEVTDWYPKVPYNAKNSVRFTVGKTTISRKRDPQEETEFHEIRAKRLRLELNRLESTMKKDRITMRDKDRVDAAFKNAAKFADEIITRKARAKYSRNNKVTP